MVPKLKVKAGLTSPKLHAYAYSLQHY